MTAPSTVFVQKLNTCPESQMVTPLPVKNQLWCGKCEAGMEKYQIKILGIDNGLVYYQLADFPDFTPHQTQLAIFLLIYTPCEQTKTVSFSSRITSLWRRFWSTVSPKRSRGNAQKAKDAIS
jgi:hypothetical protein